MALIFHRTTSSIDDLTLSLDLSRKSGPEQNEVRSTHLPAEWFPQSGVQLTWPHAGTDWAPLLPQVEECYLRIALEIALRERLIVVTPHPTEVEQLLRQRMPERAMQRISIHQADTNDTWARDHGFITLLGDTQPRLLDFQFNGWGEKFEADLDNQICRRMDEQHILRGCYEDHLDFVLEGGSIESDGLGTILTTSQCLLAPHRNQPLTKADIEERLCLWLHAQRVLWLDHGYLAGDDTDSHIDTLARFCQSDTIAYVQCTDPSDEHYEELRLMEQQLQTFRTLKDEPYRLIPLPMAPKRYEPVPAGADNAERTGSELNLAGADNAEMANGELNLAGTDNAEMANGDPERLPSTYANFLIINDAVLMPTYGDRDLDAEAHRRLQRAFPKHDIIDIDCQVLIRQHGSLHCCTMQFPMGVLPN